MVQNRDCVDAILMASGFSRRFGEENKLLVPFRGKPLAAYTLDLVMGLRYAGGAAGGEAGPACFGTVFFVAADPAVIALAEDREREARERGGPAAEAGGPECPPLGIIRNGAGERGQRESVRLGVSASGADYYLFFPCDQPFLDGDTVRRILGARRKGRIVRPAFQGRPGSPVLFSADFREDLLSLGPGEHPRDIIKRRPAALFTLELADERPLIDIDDPETLRRLAKLDP
jgi:molybdenum cofactor cytidylyltransferase